MLQSNDSVAEETNMLSLPDIGRNTLSAVKQHDSCKTFSLSKLLSVLSFTTHGMTTHNKKELENESTQAKKSEGGRTKVNYFLEAFRIPFPSPCPSINSTLNIQVQQPSSVACQDHTEGKSTICCCSFFSR